jgi:hypothetical protein
MPLLQLYDFHVRRSSLLGVVQPNSSERFAMRTSCIQYSKFRSCQIAWQSCQFSEFTVTFEPVLHSIRMELRYHRLSLSNCVAHMVSRSSKISVMSPMMDPVNKIRQLHDGNFSGTTSFSERMRVFPTMDHHDQREPYGMIVWINDNPLHFYCAHPGTIVDKPSTISTNLNNLNKSLKKTGTNRRFGLSTLSRNVFTVKQVSRCRSHARGYVIIKRRIAHWSSCSLYTWYATVHQTLINLFHAAQLYPPARQ